MTKYISVIIIALSLSFLLVGKVQAHSVVVSSDPEDGETVEDAINSVTMTFDTNIEQEEDIYLENSEGDRVDPEDVTIENDTVEVALPEALNAGDYTIFWEVYGADGHLVNGEIEFSVDAEATDETTSEEPADTENEAAEADSSDNGGMATTTIVLLIALAVIAIVVLIFFARKRR